MDIFTIDTVGGSNSENKNAEVLYSSENDRIETFGLNAEQEERIENEVDEDDDDTEYEYYGKRIIFITIIKTSIYFIPKKFCFS